MKASAAASLLYIQSVEVSLRECGGSYLFLIWFSEVAGNAPEPLMTTLKFIGHCTIPPSFFVFCKTTLTRLKVDRIYGD